MQWIWQIKNGYLHIVKFLHENHKEGCTDEAIDYASQNSHLQIVQYLHENCKEGFTKNAINFANKNNHLEIVQYLKSIKKY